MKQGLLRGAVIKGCCRLIWSVRDLQRVPFGDALQLQVLALLRDRKGVDDLHLGSIWDGETGAQPDKRANSEGVTFKHS